MVSIKPPPLPLRIDGRWVDAATHADVHPGGRWLLEYARGRDVTAIFHAIHLFREDTAAAALAKLPQLSQTQLKLPSKAGLPPSVLQHEGALQGPYVFSLDEGQPAQAPLLPIRSQLRDDLRAMLRRRFSDRQAMKATPQHWVQTAIAGLATIACWVGWLQGSLVSTLLLPFVHWTFAAHTCHEATHGALSTDSTVNFWMQFTAHPIIFNVFVWVPQHLLSHHQYTNDYQLDMDVHHFAPARLSQAQPASEREEGPPPLLGNDGWHFVWKGCLTTLGTCILQPLRTLTEKPTPNFSANITPVPAVVSKLVLLLSMLPSFFVLLYPLVAFLPTQPLHALFLTVWPWMGMSLIWTTMTQTSHVQEHCQPTEAGCWTANQIQTSLDYSRGERLATTLTGGLNAQSLHHAMPTICCCHFPQIYEVRSSDNLATAMAECLDYVFHVNDPSAQPDSAS
uniref:Fatty acid desaturase domain-containing protein n=1 Tax=Coccolithus braarudii TaxID=221442 RepID=A0A7S0Q1W9_9EUKA